MAKHRTHSGKDTDLVLLGVFNPPLNATERLREERRQFVVLISRCHGRTTTDALPGRSPAWHGRNVKELSHARKRLALDYLGHRARQSRSPELARVRPIPLLEEKQREHAGHPDRCRLAAVEPASVRQN